jgi:hypothetical protein
MESNMLKDIVAEINACDISEEKKQEVIRNLRSIVYNKKIRERCNYESAGGLASSFIWGNTPQGHGYWRTINTLIEESKRKQ